MSFILFSDRILNSVNNLNSLYFLLKIVENPVKIKPIITNKVISFVFDKFLNNIHILNQVLKYQPK